MLGTRSNRNHRLVDRVHQRIFDALYSRSLVYNTCWEDPAVDRRALQLGPDDVMLVITSAGCNVLDYALTGVRRIHAVDANPRQTALLELKLAGIRALAHEEFFRLFGEGMHPGFPTLYRRFLREQLSPFAATFWDARTHWFAAAPRTGDFASRRSGSFYSRGLAGRVAQVLRTYFDARPALRTAAFDLLECRDLDSQREIYDRRVAPVLWGRTMNWALSRQITMSLVGVPTPQHDEVRRQHPSGVPGFVREAIEYVFRVLPLWTNYFWTLYLRGRYAGDCVPEYLRPACFEALKAGLVDRVSAHTCTVTRFLQDSDETISRFVLLDHMDWMSSFAPEALSEEWRAIVARAAPHARIIFRSAHAQPAFLRTLPEQLVFHPELAQALSQDDRVHTYAGFHICDVAA